jgi:hypothetical protein
MPDRILPVPSFAVKSVARVKGQSGSSGRGEIATFHLLRLDDESGVSGIGWVAEGAVFSNGWVVLVWPTGTPSLNFYESIDDVEAVHGHGGRTRIVFDGDDPRDADL